MPEEKDWWVKSEIIAKIVSALLIPVVIVTLGYWVKKLEKEKDRVKNEEDAKLNRIMSLLEDLSSDNAMRRKLALEVAMLLSKNGKLPPGLIPTIVSMLGTDTFPSVASAAGEAVAQLVQSEKDRGDQALAEKLTKSIAGVATKKRAYIQVPDHSFNALANQLRTNLHAMNFAVPGIEAVGTARSPDRTEVRYSNDEDIPAANQIIKVIQQNGLDPAAKPKPVNCS